MLLRVPGLLTRDELAQLRLQLGQASWIDGKATAGYQSALVKQNLQLPEDSPETKALGRIILQAMGRNPLVTSGTMPLFIFPPIFNRYDTGMGFGDHIDNAVRGLLLGSSGRMRTDVSGTVFLSDPADYDGGDLLIEGAFGPQRVKLAAGDAIFYPSTTVHRVTPVTRGHRIAAILWLQSMLRDDAQRSLLYDLDVVMGNLRRRGLTGEPEMVMLTGIYHNLLRQWIEM